MMENELIIFTDGIYLPQINLGGYGYVITDLDHKFYKKEFRCDSHSDVAGYYECKAVNAALAYVPSTKLKTTLYTDSKEVLNYMDWDLENADEDRLKYWHFQNATSAAKQVQRQINRMHDIEIVQTIGHTGDSEQLHDELLNFIKA